MRRIAALACGLACLVVPASAHAATERARIIWNQADDIDLHVYDAEGREAYYSAPTAIPEASLSEDVTDSGGPETFTDDQAPSTRQFGYRVCYFEGDGSDAGRTQVTLTTVDEHGTQSAATFTLNRPGNCHRAGTTAFIPTDVDTDEDGVLDESDNCPEAANADQADADGDGLGDACDATSDSDGDGVSDGVDNCPGVANPGQEDADDNGVGDACEITDSDGDGVPDNVDNCDEVANPGQDDTDDDGVGDACEEVADTTAPTVRITSPFDHGATDDTTPVISGTAGNAPGDAFEVRVTLRSGATVLQNLTAQRSGTAWSVQAGALVPGDYTLTASQSDDASNVGTSPTSTFTVNAPPPPPDDDTDNPPPPETPQPEQGKSVVAGKVSGTVRIRLKNGKFRTLGPNEEIPLGSTVDATKGRVRLTSAAGGGKTQTADFYKGQFKITQTKGKKPITQLELNATLSCGAKASAAAKRKKKVRSLWGDGKGRFRTKGRRAAATVRGTKWFTQDKCDSTKITVKRGVVQVRDFVKRKNVTVKKGHSYVARKKKRK